MYSGLSVAEVAASEVAVNAVAEELQIFWPAERELLASILEMLHILVLTTQSAYGGKNLAKPIHIQRPWEGAGSAHGGTVTPRHPAAKKAPVISMSEFVARERRGDL